jgi:5'-nucleotidase
MNRKPRVLLTNDDGIDAPGLQKLAAAVSSKWDVFIAAPEKQKSAVSNALNISNPLRVFENPPNGVCKSYAINGTPADCVKLALTTLLDFKPDLIISGINHGQNTAINILYSGTVAGATEGMLFGVPSIAASVASHDYLADLESSIDYVIKIAEKVLNSALPPCTLLNVNIPSIPMDEIKGIMVTRQSSNTWRDRYEQRNDPFGRTYYWFAGSFADEDESPDSDDRAIKEGYVSVTPLEINFTSFKSIEKIKSVLGF